MTDSNNKLLWQPSRRQVLVGAGGLAGIASLPAMARAAPSGEPVKIGIIAELSTVQGIAIPNAAKMAVEEINARGGVMGRPVKLVIYDDHKSSSNATRAFQRLKSSDKAIAVIATYTSEVALALEPWSARLKMPFITPGASSDKISEEVHKNYDRFKYTFHGWFTSYFIAKDVVDSARDILVDQLHMKTCVIMSENADWTISLDSTYKEFLPKIGLKILDVIRFSPTTTDYTPIFNKIEAKKPDVIMTGLSHVGVVPTVQWAEQKVPIAMYGVSSASTSSAFWKDTHGAAEGVATQTGAGPDSTITPVTLPFTQNYHKRYNLLPAYCGYSAYDMVFVLAEAITRAKSTDPDKMVTALEATDHVGTLGREKFYGRKDRFTHALQFGLDLVPGVMVQWQHGKLKTIWPLKHATAKLSYPSFVKL